MIAYPCRSAPLAGLALVLALTAIAQLGCGGGSGGSADPGACTTGQTQACYTGAAETRSVGACHDGAQTCAAGAWGECAGEQLPVAEVCNGIDDNCDGQVDEGNPGGGAACTTGLPGTCAAGTMTCTGVGGVVCLQNQQARAEICDGLDDDCDGVVDNACTGCPADPLADPSFEGGSPSTAWVEASTNFGTPLCTLATCRIDGIAVVPRSGSWWAVFGGSGAAEVGSLQQEVVIAPGLHDLRLYLELSVCSANGAGDFFTVSVDGTELYRVDATSALCGLTGYQAVDLDVSAYADGRSHTLLLYASTEAVASGDVSDFMVDDLSLTCALP